MATIFGLFDLYYDIFVVRANVLELPLTRQAVSEVARLAA
jgi:hypothetical protein